jgi:adenylate cyclase
VLMGIEIERKFLLKNDSWRDHYTKKMELRQGYLSTSNDCTVRVRVSDIEGWVTIKGRTRNISCSEFEYLIPKADAESMLLEFAADNIVEKIRYFIDYHGSEWVVDEFFGRNRGLVLAEIELKSEDVICEIPSWIGEDVSGDYRYKNSNLSQKPYLSWEK